MISIFTAQHADIWPPAGKARKQSITKSPKIGGLPLIPIHQKNTCKIRGITENIELQSGKPKFSEHHENEFLEERKNWKEKASIVAQCLERKEEKVRNHAKTHWNSVSAEDVGAGMTDLHGKPHKALKKNKNKTKKTTLELDNKLPSNVIQELNTVLQKNRVLPDETSS